MKRLIFYIIFSILSLGNIIADEPPLRITEVISQNNQYKLNLISTINQNNNYIEYWEMLNIETNEVMYNFICHQFSLSGLKIFISDDGKNIVLVDWFVDWRNMNRQDIENLTVIKFYFLGKEINRYRLSDVFNNINNGIRSVSHLQWTGYNHDRNSIIMENNQIIIRTLELYEYRFNVNNGNLVNRRRL